MSVTRREVREAGVVGVVVTPDGEPSGSVVVLSGSGGGVPEGYAARLAESRLIAFALGYFGAPGLPTALVEIPIDGVARGIDWFRDAYLGGGPASVMGSSKGAELALLLGAHLGDAIDRVVAVAPSSVAWYGLDQTDPASGERSSWTFAGRPVPFLPYARDAQPGRGPDGMRLDMCYDLSRYDAAQVDDATIPVEHCRGAILLLSGSDDHMWPSASFAERIVDRLRMNGREAHVTSVVYPDAGHAFLHRAFYPNVTADGRPIWDFGGNEQADAAAAADAWPRIVSFVGARA